MSVEYLDLADFLAITELVLEVPADQISRISRLELAESALHAPAASFGGIEFCLRNGLSWSPPPDDEDGQASAQVIFDLAAGPGDDEAIATLAEWMGDRTSHTPNPPRSTNTGDITPTQE